MDKPGRGSRTDLLILLSTCLMQASLANLYAFRCTFKHIVASAISAASRSRIYETPDWHESHSGRGQDWMIRITAKRLQRDVAP